MESGSCWQYRDPDPVSNITWIWILSPSRRGGGGGGGRSQQPRHGKKCPPQIRDRFYPRLFMRNITRRLDLNLASFCAGKSANLLIFEGIRARLRSRPAEIYMPGSSRARPTLPHPQVFF